jgi:dihydroorotase
METQERERERDLILNLHGEVPSTAPVTVLNAEFPFLPTCSPSTLASRN